tara:strand:- start:738 stop:1118 length:381 start_codon:yes stop_codon:yes gene_type:complete
MKKKRILVDMTVSHLHHGHIRLLRKANKLGKVIVALTKDKEIKKNKKFSPILNYNQRKEILEAIKYVHKVIPSNFKITNKYLIKNKIDILVHGSDVYKSDIPKNKLKIFARTKNINSTKIRKILNI